MTDRHTTPPAGTVISRFMNFDSMIGPSLIRFVYFAGLVCIGLSAVFMLLSGLTMLTYSFLAGVGTIILSAVMIVIGTVMWRFYCELIILLFRIYDRLTEIRDLKIHP